MLPLFQVTAPTPLGKLRVILDERTLVAAGFTTFLHLKEKLAPLDFDRKLVTSREDQWVAELIERYFDGEIGAFVGLKVRQPGGAFSQRAWRAMEKIPSGKVISYADLAAKAGSPAAVRAAGTACARNAIAPFIPCHRIVRSDGALGNYGYGVSKKSWLLRHEGAIE